MAIRTSIAGVATGALLIGFATGGVIGRQSAEAEVRALHDLYYGYFADGHADLIAAEIYHPNRMEFGGGGVAIATGRDDVEAGMRRTMEGLAGRGYDHSEIPDASICVPNPGTAIVSGKVTRYLEDGGVMGEFGATYIYGRTPDGWRIHAFIGHDAETAVGCVG